VRECERQTLVAASVGLVAYASDGSARKHVLWTASGAASDARISTVSFERMGTRGVARSDGHACSVYRLGDRRYCAASDAPKNRPVKLITASS
jgi:hypothetical protein